MNSDSRKSTLPYVMCILIQSVVYGLGNPLTKVGFDSITALWCLAIRFSAAAVLLFIIFGKRTVSQLKVTKPSQWLPPSICMASAYISCNIALGLTTATNVGFVMSLPVIFTPFLSVLLLKKKYPVRSVPIQLAVVVGLYLLCCGGGSFSFGMGEVVALICALSLAFALVFSEKCLNTLDAFSMSTVQTAVTAVISVAAAFMFDDVSVLPGVEMRAWLIIAYLVVTCTCLAYIMQNIALSHISSGMVSMLQCTQPILTAFFSFILLKERLSIVGIIGAVIITLCVVIENYVNYREERTSSNAEPAQQV